MVSRALSGLRPSLFLTGVVAMMFFLCSCAAPKRSNTVSSMRVRSHQKREGNGSCSWAEPDEGAGEHNSNTKTGTGRTLLGENHVRRSGLHSSPWLTTSLRHCRFVACSHGHSHCRWMPHELYTTSRSGARLLSWKRRALSPVLGRVADSKARCLLLSW